MMHIVTRMVAALAATAATMAVAIVAPAYAQGAPLVDRVQFEETVPDEFFTGYCGVPVTATVKGMITTRTFLGDGAGPRELRTINVAITLSANGNTFRVRDVGVDLTRVEPDGTAVLLIVGQIPFDFTGALKIDLETGEAILEPRHSTQGELDEACEVLTS